jgi:hypothetical protein
MIRVIPRPNQVPLIELVNPGSGVLFETGATIPLVASATDLDGTISKVEFSVGSQILGQALQEPFSFEWMPVQPGSYSVTAKAIDNLGATGVSSPTLITVSPPRLDSITLSPDQKHFHLGASSSLNLVSVVANYSNNTVATITRTDVTWGIQAGAGTLSGNSYLAPTATATDFLTASFCENGKCHTATLTIQVRQNPVRWLTDFEAAKTLSISTRKRIFLNFHANWCPYSRALDKEALSDGEIIERLNSRYIPVRCDDSASSTKALMEKYKATGFPTAMILHLDTFENMGTMVKRDPVSVGQFLDHGATP